MDAEFLVWDRLERRTHDEAAGCRRDAADSNSQKARKDMNKIVRHVLITFGLLTFFMLPQLLCGQSRVVVQIDQSTNINAVAAALHATVMDKLPERIYLLSVPSFEPVGALPPGVIYHEPNITLDSS